MNCVTTEKRIKKNMEKRFILFVYSFFFCLSLTNPKLKGFDQKMEKAKNKTNFEINAWTCSSADYMAQVILGYEIAKQKKNKTKNINSTILRTKCNRFRLVRARDTPISP